MNDAEPQNYGGYLTLYRDVGGPRTQPALPSAFRLWCWKWQYRLHQAGQALRGRECE